ncbi:MAG: 1-acyl-sn-glycerol-3-phosphate acyltransferase [Lachnospiraceae bacterium]|nr:1-acyl-sn-glycerol-3-phosphate acyltransferase [Lachnospiraceae bacterium]
MKVVGWIVLGLLGLVVLFLLFLILCALPVDLNREYEDDSRFYWFLVKLNAHLGLFVGRVRVHVSGQEIVPKEGRYLLVSNHRSNFDPFVGWSRLIDDKLIYISKPSNMKVFVYGKLAHRIGCLTIDRENPRNSIKTLARAAELLKSGKRSVGVYPEGTRNRDGGLLPFHNGVFKPAQRAGVPIVVTCLSGTEKITKNLPWHHTDVWLDFIEVIPAEEVQALRTEDIGERVRADIEKQLALREKA